MSKLKIVISKVNETWGQMYCDDPTLMEAAVRKFAVPVENYWFMPAFKAGRWDGKIRFVQPNGKFYCGMFSRVLKYVKNDDLYELIVDPQFDLGKTKSEHKDEFLESTGMLELPFEPYRHQVRGAMKASYFKRGICRHVTSAGKSLTIALTINQLLQENKKHKILILVPKLDLVEQFVENLEEYGIPIDLVGKYCGYTKEPEMQIVVSTWQSIHKKKDLLREFTVLIGDECHGLKADVVRSVAEKAVNAKIRLGFTGTMPDQKADYLLIEGVLGPVVDEVEYEELQKANQIAGIKINIVNCIYPGEVVEEYEERPYIDEKNLIEGDPQRNKIICKIAKTYADKDQNSLILVKKLDHSKAIADMLEAAGVNVSVVTGQTKIGDRNNVRHQTEKSGGNVIVATVGVYSTGVSIKRLHSVIFASPGKSKIQTLQSVGRGLRLHDTKTDLHLYDIAENLKFSKKHLKQRIKYYKNSKFEYKVKDITQNG